ncbi:hypothetical protein PRZ48_010892 [Zasmidium cellare]|uniref:Uncharacterized protein n=1 Tax=Zasmidium cellare TaxID=395010 RepID=A0ABR0EAF8_ZASCE|nr:hypothetical protein PRZ48_010892 [Zasmidium cellare]
MTGPFRILDLAAELRNNIYEHALTHDRSNGITATVGLLRTCRQVYSESKAIFYAESTATITVRLSHQPHHGGTKNVTSVVLAGDMTNASLLHEPTMALFRGLPQHLVEVPRIHIQLDFDVAPRGSRPLDGCEAVNRFLYALSDLLNSDRRPRRLDVSSKRSIGERADSCLETALWPLRKMQHHIDIHLQDDLRREAGGLLDGVPERRHVGLTPTLVSDFLLLVKHVPSSNGSSDSTVHRYGYERLEEVEGKLYLERGKWAHYDHVWFPLQFLVARGLLSMDTRKELEDISHAPDWLVACAGLLEKLRRTGNLSAKEYLKLQFRPLEHLIDAIPEEK